MVQLLDNNNQKFRDVKPLHFLALPVWSQYF